MRKEDALPPKPSRFLKAEDLGDKEPQVVIDRVVMEQVSETDNKPVVYFRNKEKGVVLNNTRWDALEFICDSHDSDEWIGQTIRLAAGKTKFGGQYVPCIVIKPPKKEQPQGGQRQVVSKDRGSYKISTTAPTEDAPFDDEVPDFR